MSLTHPRLVLLIATLAAAAPTLASAQSPTVAAVVVADDPGRLRDPLLGALRARGLQPVPTDAIDAAVAFQLQGQPVSVANAEALRASVGATVLYFVETRAAEGGARFFAVHRFAQGGTTAQFGRVLPDALSGAVVQQVLTLESSAVASATVIAPVPGGAPLPPALPTTAAVQTVPVQTIPGQTVAVQVVPVGTAVDPRAGMYGARLNPGRVQGNGLAAPAAKRAGGAMLPGILLFGVGGIGGLLATGLGTVVICSEGSAPCDEPIALSFLPIAGPWILLAEYPALNSDTVALYVATGVAQALGFAVGAILIAVGARQRSAPVAMVQATLPGLGELGFDIDIAPDRAGLVGRLVW